MAEQVIEVLLGCDALEGGLSLGFLNSSAEVVQHAYVYSAI
jgi:hypothetical protein